MTIPVYINNFNWLTSTRSLAEWFSMISGIEPIIVDNASTYPPLLDWYASKSECPYKVIYLEGNCGHHAPWNQSCVLWGHTHRAMFGSDFYAVTDSDLDFSGVPLDVFDVCLEGFSVVPTAVKSGVGLRVDDLPEHSKKRVLETEGRYWIHPVSERYFSAPIDTTFAVYKAHIQHQIAMNLCVPTLRTNSPYVARHLPWYWQRATLTCEQEYYFSRSNTYNTWRPE